MARGDDLHRWQPLRPDEIGELLADCRVTWWIAGGWAIDLFLGESTREHSDIDVLILRKDQHDFDRVVPQLSASARQWLRNALSLQFIHGHEWMERLNPSPRG